MSAPLDKTHLYYQGECPPQPNTDKHPCPGSSQPCGTRLGSWGHPSPLRRSHSFLSTPCPATVQSGSTQNPGPALLSTLRRAQRRLRHSHSPSPHCLRPQTQSLCPPLPREQHGRLLCFHCSITVTRQHLGASETDMSLRRLWCPSQGPWMNFWLWSFPHFGPSPDPAMVPGHHPTLGR